MISHAVVVDPNCADSLKHSNHVGNILAERVNRQKAVLFVADELSENILDGYVRAVKSKGLAFVLLIQQKDALRSMEEIKLRNPKHVFHQIDHVEVYDNLWIEELLRKSQLLAMNYDFVAVLESEDHVTVESTLVAQSFGLPNIGLKSATIARNKYAQRRLLADTPWGVRFDIHRFDALHNVSLPAKGVIKPIDWGASTNVVLWHQPQDKEKLLGLIQPSIPQQYFLVEELIEGPEYSLEAWIQDGRILNSNVVQKQTQAPGVIERPVEIGHKVNASEITNELKDELQRLLHIVVERTGVENTMIHLEFKIDSAGRPRVMEWANRNPGDRIMDLYQYAGFSPYLQLLETRLGGDSRRTLEETPIHFSRDVEQWYYSIAPGFTFSKEKLLQMPWVSLNVREPNYGGYTKLLSGVQIEGLDDLRVHELSVLRLSAAENEEILDSHSRHYSVVVSFASGASRDARESLRKFIESNFMVRHER